MFPLEVGYVRVYLIEFLIRGADEESRPSKEGVTLTCSPSGSLVTEFKFGNFTVAPVLSEGILLDSSLLSIVIGF